MGKVKDQLDKLDYYDGHKAGIKEVVEYVEDNRYSTSLHNVTFRISKLQWQAQLKEWGVV